MCSKVVQPTSLVVVFETLLSSAATTLDEEKGNPSWQARGDFYVFCILSCLPWGGSELVEVLSLTVPVLFMNLGSKTSLSFPLQLSLNFVCMYVLVFSLAACGP